MATVVLSEPQRLAVMEDVSVLPGLIQIQGFEPSSCLISGVEYDKSTRHLFQTALDRRIFLFRFGKRMGELKIRGLCFPESCDSGGSDGSLSAGIGQGGQSGTAEVLAWYEENNLANSDDQVQVTIAGVVVAGFLSRVTLGSVGGPEDPNWAGITQFTFEIHAPPEVNSQ